MKRFLFLIVLALGINTAFCKLQALYFELGGPSLASFNLDTRFSKKEDSMVAALVSVGLVLTEQAPFLFLLVLII